VYRTLPLLKAGDFALDSHRRIFHAIAELANAGKPIDDLTVCSALAGSGQLEAVGGVAYLAGLSDQVDAGLACVTNVEHYASLLLDKSRRRQGRAAAECLIAQTDDPSVSTDAALQ